MQMNWKEFDSVVEFQLEGKADQLTSPKMSVFVNVNMRMKPLINA